MKRLLKYRCPIGPDNIKTLFSNVLAVVYHNIVKKDLGIMGIYIKEYKNGEYKLTITVTPDTESHDIMHSKIEGCINRLKQANETKS